MNEFTHIPTFADYWHLNRHVFLKSTRKIVWIAVAMIAVFLLSPWVLKMNHSSLGTFEAYQSALGMLLLPGILLLMYGMTYYGARVRWKKSSDLRSPKTYSIGEEGLVVKGEGFEGLTSWQHIVHAEQTSGWFFLKTGQNVFYYFPQSAIPDPASLVDLIRRKVAKTDGMN